MAGTVPNRYLPPNGSPSNPSQKPVGYGLKGHPFYNIEKYHQSKAYAQKQAQKPTPGVPNRYLPPPSGGGIGSVSVSSGNRLGGVRPTFPHPGAPPAPGTMDQHIEAARLAMLRATQAGR